MKKLSSYWNSGFAMNRTRVALFLSIAGIWAAEAVRWRQQEFAPKVNVSCSGPGYRALHQRNHRFREPIHLLELRTELEQ